MNRCAGAASPAAIRARCSLIISVTLPGGIGSMPENLA